MDLAPPPNYQHTRIPVCPWGRRDFRARTPTSAAPSIAQAPEAFRSHIRTNAECVCARSKETPNLTAFGLVVPVGEVLSSHPLVWMLYCRGPGSVLHALGVVHSPWNMLSGVRFSCTTTITCWKDVIWAAAGAVRQSAANVKGNSRFTTFPLATKYCGS
jgi:hypothetical protein